MRYLKEVAHFCFFRLDRASLSPVAVCSAADTRQSQHRPPHPGSSLPVSPAERLGREYGWQGLGNATQKTDCEVGDGQQVVEFGRGSRQQKCSLAGRVTRGDRVELIVSQRYRTFSFCRSILCGIRCADGRQQRRRGHQTKNFATHHTLSIIKR